MPIAASQGAHSEIPCNGKTCATEEERAVTDKERTISRRDFLTFVTAGTAFALGGLSGCATVITYRATVVGGRIPLVRSELEQLGGDKPVLVKVPELPDPVILIPVDGQKFRAVSAKCTHLGCHVRPSKNFLVCPCHGSTYDLEGQVVRGPAPSALTTYPVEAKGDKVEIIIF
jgi:Rieske Fe-S protein